MAVHGNLRPFDRPTATGAVRVFAIRWFPHTRACALLNRQRLCARLPSQFVSCKKSQAAVTLEEQVMLGCSEVVTTEELLYRDLYRGLPQGRATHLTFHKAAGDTDEFVALIFHPLREAHETPHPEYPRAL